MRPSNSIENALNKHPWRGLYTHARRGPMSALITRAARPDAVRAIAPAVPDRFSMPTIDEDSLAESYDELPLWSAPFGLALLDAVRLRPTLTLLDIGCGTGFRREYERSHGMK